VYSSRVGYIEAKNIVPGESLVIIENGSNKSSHVVSVKIELVNKLPVYDISVEQTSCFFANNILVHNCAEIALPTGGFNSVEELYDDYKEDLNFIEFKDQNNQLHHLYSFDNINTQRGEILSKDLRLNDVIDNNIIVTKIVERSVAPEIALKTMMNMLKLHIAY
jgi:hypothetical protein